MRPPVSNGARIALVVLGLLIALWLLVQLRSLVVLLALFQRRQSEPRPQG